MRGTWNRKVAFALAAFALTLIAAPRALAEDIRIALDEAFPVRIASAAEGVAIGNSSIAGVSVQDDHLLFVTGRAYGTTNLVIVGANGRLLYSGRIIVAPNEDGAVIVTRGTATTRMICGSVCRPAPDIGDDPATFSAANDQISTHASTAAAN